MLRVYVDVQVRGYAGSLACREALEWPRRRCLGCLVSLLSLSELCEALRNILPSLGSNCIQFAIFLRSLGKSLRSVAKALRKVSENLRGYARFARLARLARLARFAKLGRLAKPARLARLAKLAMGAPCHPRKCARR